MADRISFANGGVRIPFDFTGRIQIGRDPSSDVLLVDETVSRRHAVLWRDGPQSWRICDQQSRNGTWVNGVRVKKDARVQPGDTIKFGRVSVTFADLGDALTVGPTQRDTTLATSRLTSREESVLRRVALGDTDQQIADDLIISIRTVQAHLDSIRDKAGARRRPELVKYALRTGIVTVDEITYGGL